MDGDKKYLNLSDQVVHLTSEMTLEGLDQTFAEILSAHFRACKVAVFRGESKGVDSTAGLLASNKPGEKMKGDHILKLGPPLISRKLVIDGALKEGWMKEVDTVLKVYENQLIHLKRSMFDNLTNLMNREAFEQVFRKPSQDYLNDRRRNLEKASLVLVDIDYFKSINDRFGHMMGDEVLLLFARLMKAALRASDLVFRLGGEEFGIVLHGVNKDRAIKVAEKLRGRIESYEFPQVGKVTASIGLCVMYNPDSSDLYMSRADAALYYAKTHGRNRVCCYEKLREDDQIQSVEAHQGSVEFFNIQKQLI